MPPADAALVVGFDLDMTLVDSRPGIAHCLRLLAAETGRPIDIESIVGHLGPPVQQALAPWFSSEEMPGIVTRWRELMAVDGVRNCTPLPGAVAALAAVTALGGRTLIVTAKHRPLAVSTASHAGLHADSVVGDLWAEGKAVALLAARATVYVGDHPADVRAARAANAVPVAVATGGAGRDELLETGAAAVLDSLEEFPTWLERHLQPAH